MTVGQTRTRGVRNGLFACLSAGFLAACTVTGNDSADRPVVSPHPDLFADAADYPRALRMVALRQREHERRWQCVPFAREMSGIEIYGDAWTWWNAAAEEGFRRVTGRSPGRSWCSAAATAFATAMSPWWRM